MVPFVPWSLEPHRGGDTVQAPALVAAGIHPNVRCPLSRSSFPRAALLPLLLAACGSDDQVLAPSPEFHVASPASPRHATSIPFLATGHRRGCEGRRYREFNFWLGRWEVREGTGVVGTNRVERTLTGCAVTERWVASNGFPGRSLNSYDDATGKWHQFWVDGGGGSLILEGGATRAGGMILSQTRPVQFNGPLAIDRLEWSRQKHGRVLQTWDRSTDDGTTFSRLFEGTYVRSDLPPATPAPSGLCADPARLRFHRFDFTVGTWQVSRGGDGSRIGRSAITKDLGDCLVEERFEGRRDHQVLGFAALDIVALNWYREYVTSEGVRLALRGDLVDGQMVLVGSAGAGRTIRVTWIADGTDRFRQVWELSTDSGTSYLPVETLVYDRAG